MADRRPYLLLTLIRCGETRWEREGRLHGQTDLPLSNSGRAAATDTAAHLGNACFHTVYHPPDEAAAESARLIAHAASARTRASGGLNEPGLGLLEGLRIEEFAGRHPRRHKQWEDDPLALQPPEGEAFAEARIRVFTELARLFRKIRGEEVGVVLHPIALGLLHCWFADRPARNLWRILDERRNAERYLLAGGVISRLRQMSDTAPQDS